MKKSQLIMIWFLPLIVIGGLFNPWLGYLVLAMMAFFLVLSFFKGRYWCWNLCPRGAFLDILISRLSFNRPLRGIFIKQWFRWAVLVLLMGFLIFRIIHTGGNLIMIGSVFVAMCLLTTIISIILGVLTKHRSWCMICPMGFLQEKIGKIKRRVYFCLVVGIILFCPLAQAANLSVDIGGLNQSFPGPDLFYPITDNIDLQGKAYLEFKWRRGNFVYTQNYDFRLYKGYETIASNLIMKKIISVDDYPFKVDSSVFGINQVYTWVLRQITLDGKKSDKSLDSFKIIKK